MNKINNIMAVIDGTAASTTASLYSIFLAKLLGAKLYGIYVINEKALNDLLHAHIFIEEEKIDYEKELEHDAEKYLGNFKNNADLKNVYAEIIIKKGIVHEEVIKEVNDKEIDILVVGGLRKVISVRESSYDEKEIIVRNANCNVLIVKDDEKVEMLYKNM